MAAPSHHFMQVLQVGSLEREGKTCFRCTASADQTMRGPCGWSDLNGKADSAREQAGMEYYLPSPYMVCMEMASLSTEVPIQKGVA